MFFMRTARIRAGGRCSAARSVEESSWSSLLGNHFELWDKDTYDTLEAKAMQGEMPDVFKDFSF